jgi:hypothetical protein
MTEIVTPPGLADKMPRVSPDWLALREAADAAARASELVAAVRGGLLARLPGAPTVIHDLGCGTGAMGRWLAPQLPGPQHWIMYDRDPVLLARAAESIAGAAADAAAVTVETRQRDIAELTSADLAGAHLVTAAALADLLTAEEVDGIAAACAGAGCPALLTTCVVGRVDLDPAEPLDGDVMAAFNGHQRRVVAGRRLLGPDAVDAAVEAFGRRGMATTVRPSPWRLGPGEPELLSQWFTGWVDAAREQEPALADRLDGYAARRRAQVAAGRLRAVVHHLDVLASPA